MTHFIHGARARYLAVGALAAVCGLEPAVPRADDASTRHEWHFDVLLDGKPIGRHDFIVTDTDDSAEVVSRARFLVTVLHIPVYRYEHDDHERWRGGCLVQIDATTRDNGSRTHVHGDAVDASFDLAGPQGTRTLSGCVHSFAYWDPHLLAAPRLLNAQTGEYQPVHLARAADSAAGQHYRLEGNHLHIELWYGASGEWRALESHTADGRTLRYEIHS